MEAVNYYEVVVRKKVPYVTVFLQRLCFFFLICFLVVEIFMLPTRNVPPEMALAWFNLFLPDVIKSFMGASIIGLFVTTILYLNVRLYKRAVLTFDKEEISIAGSSIHLLIKTADLRKVTFMDESKEVGGVLKEKFTVYFEIRSAQSVRIRLLHYIQSQEFTDEFLAYENIAYEFMNVDFSADLQNEI